ncbi:MAG TPA: metalloregulator ArsR/SmtB family transcription factor [Ktedonobacterales bacterium]|jgi:DNA-binding transcriptional ArsR family regulator
MTNGSGVSSTPEVLPGAASPPSLGEADLLARFFRALGDPTRLRLLTLLLEQERSVTDLVEAVGAPQGRISTHLGCLRWCGLVTARREGRQMIYAITDPRVRALLSTAGTMLHDYATGVASCGVIR